MYTVQYSILVLQVTNDMFHVLLIPYISYGKLIINYMYLL